MCSSRVVSAPPGSSTNHSSPTIISINGDHPDILQPLLPKPSVPPHAQPIMPHLSLPAAAREAGKIAGVALPLVLSALLLYSRSMLSMLFLGSLGEMSIAGGALAMGFANITGYSILSGFAAGMEPVCGQAFGANKHSLLGLALQRTVLMLLALSLPISLLWIHMKTILLLCGQDAGIAEAAQSYILFSLPDLFAQSLLHPIRIYLRAQSLTSPVACCAAASLLLHLPVTYLLVYPLGLGIRGVALGGGVTSCSLVLFLVFYIAFSGVHKGTWGGVSRECLREWRPLLELSIPSCISVCLEWWWYEIMILLCGLLLDPKATVASMGILIQTTSLIYIFPSSLSFGVSTRVGNELGANRPAAAKLSAMTALALSFFMGLLALLFTLLVRRVWSRIFTEDEVILRLTSAVLPIIGLCEMGNCPQTTMCGVLRGAARPRVAAAINLGSFYAVGMPVAVCLGFWLGFDFQGLWLGLLAAQGSCAVLMLVALWRTNWEREANRAKELTATGVVSSPIGDGEEKHGKEDQFLESDKSLLC